MREADRRTIITGLGMGLAVAASGACAAPPRDRKIGYAVVGLGRTLELAQPISIGDDCWLGGGTIVCPGVSIGAGCVIGAGAVVTKDVPPYSLAVGNPARVIKSLQ